jgi:pimeloyl-ACP methyl ester carboxylesterase
MRFVRFLKVGARELFYLSLWPALTLGGGFLDHILETIELFIGNYKIDKRNNTPIILIPGTLSGRGTLLILKLRLKRYFSRVFLFSPRFLELASITESTEKLHRFLSHPNLMKPVILIGHSQGGRIASEYLMLYGWVDRHGFELVKGVIGLGAPFEGSWAPVLAIPFLFWARSLWEMLPIFTKRTQDLDFRLLRPLKGEFDFLIATWPCKRKGEPKTEIIPDCGHVGIVVEKKAFNYIKKAIDEFLISVE